MHDEPRSDLEQRALAAWTPSEPPADFVDRVMQAAARQSSGLPGYAPNVPPIDLPGPRLRWPRFAAAAIAAVALAGGITAGIKLWPTTAVPAVPTAPSEPREPSDGGETVKVTPAAARSVVGEVPGDLAAQVDRYMSSFGQHYGDAFKFQGTVIVRRRGETLYTGNFGRADIATAAPITADTRFKIGSLTQQFTAVAILQLRDAGKLQLDDLITRHLPGFPEHGVTIRHLLSHSSGLHNYTDTITTKLKRGTPYAPQKIIDTFQDVAPRFTPGSDFDPSNSGYFLLGMIVEKAAGVPFGPYLQEHIFSPAGLTHTTLGLPADPIATGYVFSEDELLVPAVPYDLSVYGGAAGIVSSPADLARWDTALQRPDVLLGQRSLDEMFTSVVESYGLGWIVVKERGQTMVGHPGGVEGFNGALARYLGDGITVIALANTEAIDCRAVLDAVSAIAHGEPVPPYAEHIEVPVPADMFSRYIGTFRMTPAARTKLATMVDRDDLGAMAEVTVYNDGGRLFMLVPGHGAKWLHGLGEDRFFFKDLAGTTAQFGPPDAPVEWLRLWKEDLEFVLARSPPAPNTAEKRQPTVH